MGDSTEWNGFPEPKAGFPFAYRPPLSLKGRGRAARRLAGGRRPPPAPRAVAPPLTPVRPKTEGLTGLKDSADARGPAPTRPLPKGRGAGQALHRPRGVGEREEERGTVPVQTISNGDRMCEMTPRGLPPVARLTTRSNG